MDDEIKFIIVMIIIILLFILGICIFLQLDYLWAKNVYGDPNCFWIKCVKTV